jgi:hypothetical protein
MYTQSENGKTVRHYRTVQAKLSATNARGNTNVLLRDEEHGYLPGIIDTSNTKPRQRHTQ